MTSWIVLAFVGAAALSVIFIGAGLLWRDGSQGPKH